MKIDIPKPCPEKWENMTPNNLGRHCDSCAKTVVDFRNLSDFEIKNFLSHQKETICAAMKPGQMNRELHLPTYSTSIDLRAVAMGLSVLALSGTVLAHSELAPTTTLHHQTYISPTLAETETEEAQLIQDTIRVLIIDKASGEGMPFAKVRILDSNSTLLGGAISDLDGHITIVRPETSQDKQLHLEISSVGYKSIEMKWDELKAKSSLTLEAEETELFIIGSIQIDKKATRRAMRKSRREDRRNNG